MLGVNDCALTSHNLDLGPAILCMHIMRCCALLCIIRLCRARATS